MTREEKLTKLQELHNRAKEHPYWLNFDNTFLGDIGKLFQDMTCCIYGVSDETNPYYVILRASTHDMCCMARNLTYYEKTGRFEKNKSNIILSLQSFLTNVHKLLEGHESEERVTNYLSPFPNSTCVEALWFEDEGKYRALSVIRSAEDMENVKYKLNGFANLNSDHCKHTREWAIQCLDDIENKRKIIGKHWLNRIE